MTIVPHSFVGLVAAVIDGLGQSSKDSRDTSWSLGESPRRPETPKPETPKPRNPETPKPRNPETPKPRNPENPKP